MLFYNNVVFCNGILNSDQFVLSSALCVTSDATEYSIYLGAYNLDDLDQFEGFEISKIHLYDAFDIALLKMKSRVSFNEFIQPICLFHDHVAPLSTGILAGYHKKISN